MARVLLLLATLPLLLLLSGCASRVNEMMRSWEGAHVSDLVAKWGPPNQALPDGALHVGIKGEFNHDCCLYLLDRVLRLLAAGDAGGEQGGDRHKSKSAGSHGASHSPRHAQR